MVNKVQWINVSLLFTYDDSLPFSLKDNEFLWFFFLNELK